MKKLSFILVLLVISGHVFSLEIDEKLTMRIVKTSESKKTILINRGVEDGLVKGDHAKFFLTIGVVARGVVVKLAPTRSVWSIYRLVNADYIKDNQVMKLKITAPVKITKDESKSLVSDDTPLGMNGDPRDLGIPLAEGADDFAKLDGQAQAGQSKSNESFTLMEATSLRTNTKELYGSIHYSGLGATAAPSDASGNYTGQAKTFILNVGVELYNEDEKSWLSRFSLVGQYSMANTAVMTHEGTNTVEDSSEYGGGIHWYPTVRPSRTYKLMPYAKFLFMMGSVTTTYNPGLSSAPGASSESLSGSSVSYLLGGGVKYYIHKRFGARLELDYYNRGDQFAADQNGVKWVTTKSGPRINMGLSYRW